MSDLANANSHARGQGARGPGRAQPSTADVDHPVVVDRRPFIPAHPVGTPKPASMDIATNNHGMTPPFPRLSGAHGVIGDGPPVPDLTGGMRTFATSRRTLRRAPLVPWDEGTEIGR